LNREPNLMIHIQKFDIYILEPYKILVFCTIVM
jgi:hypothetical protein